jgi:cystathionine beta-lyase
MSDVQSTGEADEGQRVADLVARLDQLDPAWLAAKRGAKWRRTPGALAAWVADMDFPPSEAVTAALARVLREGDLGYPNWGGASPMRQVLADRMASRFGWEVDVHRVREVCDVVQAVQITLHLATEPGDGVVLHTPAYHPFLSTLDEMHRPVVPIPARRATDGWVFDLDGLDERIEAARARALILCHPHNPTGRAFTEPELREVAAMAARHDLLVISDEIHADLVHDPHVHVPFARVAAASGARCVTVTSASKAFNLAGLRWAVAVVDDDATFRAWQAHPGHLFGASNLAGVLAARAAWTEGADWLTAVRILLDRNRRRFAAGLAERLPGCDHVMAEATYLAWVDCRPLELGEEPADVFARHGLVVSPGADFGAPGFARVNLATDTATLDRILDAMAGAFAAHLGER